MVNFLTDPFFLGVVLLRVLLFLKYNPFDFGEKTPLHNGYDVDADLPLSPTGILTSQEFYMMLVTGLEYYILRSIIAPLWPSGSLGLVPVLDIPFGTLVIGGILGLRISVVWWLPSLEHASTGEFEGSIDEVIELSGIFACALFGIATIVQLAVAIHPNEELIQLLFQHHVNLSLSRLSNFKAILGFQFGGAFSETADFILDFGVPIFANNVGLALRGGFLALVLAVFTVGILAPVGGMVMIVNGGELVGVFIGLLIRNAIALGAGVLAPVMGWTAGMGLYIGGHLFHEYFGIAVLITGMAVAGFGFAKRRDTAVQTGVVTIILGILDIAYASLAEVTIDTLPVDIAKGPLPVRTDVLSISFNTVDKLAVGSEVAFTLVMMAVIAIGVQLVIQYLRRAAHLIERFVWG